MLSHDNLYERDGKTIDVNILKDTFIYLIFFCNNGGDFHDERSSLGVITFFFRIIRPLVFEVVS